MLFNFKSPHPDTKHHHVCFFSFLSIFPIGNWWEKKNCRRDNKEKNWFDPLLRACHGRNAKKKKKCFCYAVYKSKFNRYQHWETRFLSRKKKPEIKIVYTGQWMKRDVHQFSNNSCYVFSWRKKKFLFRSQTELSFRVIRNKKKAKQTEEFPNKKISGEIAEKKLYTTGAYDTIRILHWVNVWS